MDADDVKLFGDPRELGVVTAEWAKVLKKDINGKKLTEEEEKTRNLYSRLGIFDNVTFFCFIAAQSNLLDR